MQTLTVQEVAGQIEAGEVLPASFTVKADDWKEFLQLKAEISSCERRKREVQERFGFPKASEVERDFRAVIVNGNGDEVGKFTVFWKKPEEQPRAGCWVAKIS